MIAIVVGILIGFLMCIPVGPINVWVVNTLLKHNFKAAISIALGGSLVDFVYFYIVSSGLSFFNFSEKTVLVLKIIGVLFLLVFGLKELFAKEENFDLEKKDSKNLKSASFFAIGILISVSNPTIVATMSALAAVVKSWGLFEYELINITLLSLGVYLGAILWFYFLLKIITKYQNKIPQKFYYRFSKASGVLILIFSFIMAFNVYKEFSV